jgi:hypothetical protein
MCFVSCWGQNLATLLRPTNCEETRAALGIGSRTNHDQKTYTYSFITSYASLTSSCDNIISLFGRVGFCKMILNNPDIISDHP